MAMLLAMYQKMRLIREKNQATLDLTRFSSKYDRVSKNIERVQKMYTSKIASLESQAKMKMSMAKSVFQQQSGLAIGGNSAFLNPYQMGAGNAVTAQFLQSYIQKGIPYTYTEDKGIQPVTDGKTLNPIGNNAQELYRLYMQGKLGNLITDENDNTKTGIKGADGKFIPISAQEYNMFQAAVSEAQNQYYYRSNWLSQSTSNYETNVSIWLEAAKAQLEAEQDAAVEPLAYQQTMWELEKTQTEAKLERIKADLESYDRLLGDETKGHAPHFGLG